MFVCSAAQTESCISDAQDIWKCSHMNAVHQSTYSTARSLSACCEDRYTSLLHNACRSYSELQANVDSMSVCLSNQRSVKHIQKQKLPIATASSLMLSTLSLQSACEPHAADLLTDTRVTSLPASALTVCSQSACWSISCMALLHRCLNNYVQTA